MIGRLAVKIISKAALGCALVSVLSIALSSQTVPSQANPPHVPMMTDGYGVTNIAGQPFSADLEIDRIQTLADGSHIALAPKHTSESLGMQTIEGISVQGMRGTTTWPVNSQGNDAVFATITEEWTSEEMGVEVLRKTNDPRFGEQFQRFTNIVRGEPSPSLFQVPADYTIKNSQ
jgi:hypothetical protein